MKWTLGKVPNRSFTVLSASRQTPFRITTTTVLQFTLRRRTVDSAKRKLEEATVAFGYASRNSYASFLLSNFLRASITRWLHAVRSPFLHGDCLWHNNSTLIYTLKLHSKKGMLVNKTFTRTIILP